MLLHSRGCRNSDEKWNSFFISSNLQFIFREITGSTYVTFLTSSANYVLVASWGVAEWIEPQPELEGQNVLKADTNNLNEVQQCCFFIKTPKQLREDVILLC